jgi:hypothetical protein
MDGSHRQPWVRAVILVGVVYGVVGILFGSLANPSVSAEVRVMWRLAAWVASAFVYAAHIGYESFRLGHSPRSTALHTAMAAGLGAFILAVAATVHSLSAASNTPHWRFLVALVAWPVVTALPAFLVALLVAAVLARLPRRA